MDKDKTKEQLLEELAGLQRQVREMAAFKNECLQTNKKFVEAQRYAQDIINSSMDMIIAVDKKRCRTRHIAGRRHRRHHEGFPDRGTL